MSFFNRKSKRDEILKAIEEHRKLTQKTNEKLDEFMQASLDGENGWFFQPKRKQEDKRYGPKPLSGNTCTDIPC